MLHSKFNYVIHLDGHVHPAAINGTLEHGEEETSTLLQPSPRSRKVLVADLSKDLYGVCLDYLTHRNVYEFTINDVANNQYRVWCNNGGYRWFSCNYFKEVYLYDEDETLLTCRYIEFKEGDYIDLRKHTPEQIRHIAKYYEFYDVEGLLEDSGYIFAVFDGVNFDGTDSYTRTKGKQYTYGDIFYLEEN